MQWLLSAGNKYCKGGIKLGGIRRVKGGGKRRKRRRQREYKEQNNALCKHYNLFWLLFVRLAVIETPGGGPTEQIIETEQILEKRLERKKCLRRQKFFCAQRLDK